MTMITSRTDLRLKMKVMKARGEGCCSAYDYAELLYYEFPAFSRTGTLDGDIIEFAKSKFCHITPDYLILAEPWPAQKSWHVYLAVGQGALPKFFELMPYELPYITFVRAGKEIR